MKSGPAHTGVSTIHNTSSLEKKTRPITMPEGITLSGKRSLTLRSIRSGNLQIIAQASKDFSSSMHSEEALAQGLALS